MKKILAAIIAYYGLTSGQTPPVDPIPPATTGATTLQTLVQATTKAATTKAATTGVPIASLAPVTSVAPVTPVTTQAAAALPPGPTTPAPTTNPYCSPTQAFDAMGQQQTMLGGLGSWQTNQNAQCRTYNSRALDWEGQLTCNKYHCCMCAEIHCGGSGYPCENFQVSDWGAIGAQNIKVTGGVGGFWGSTGWQNGAQISCGGLESCMASRITGELVGELQCSGDKGCAGANIILNNPAEQMKIQCNGLQSCANTNIEVNIPPNFMEEIGTIEFNGEQAGFGAIITLRNHGMNPVVIRNIECMSNTACINTQFIIEGNFMIENCDLQGIQNLNALNPMLRACVLGQQMGNNFPFPQQMPPNTLPGFPQQFPQQQFPQQQFPQQQFPQQQFPQQQFPQQPQVQPQFPQQPQVQPQPQPQQPQVQPQQPVNPNSNPNTVPNTVPNTMPVTPGLLIHGQNPGGLQCDMPNQCQNKAFEITPMLNSWQLDCSLPFGCSGMQLTLNVGYGGNYVDSLKFAGANSGFGATININNVMGPYGAPIEINDLRCEAIGSCSGLTIVAGPGVDIWSTNFDCQQPGSCTNCWVKQGTMVQACDPNQNQGIPAFNQMQYPGMQYPGMQYPYQNQWI